MHGIPPGMSIPGITESEPSKKDDRTPEEKRRESLQNSSERQRLIWMEYSGSKLDTGDWVRMDKLSRESDAENELMDREQHAIGSLSTHRLKTRLLTPGFYQNIRTGESVRLRKDLTVVALPVDVTSWTSDKEISKRYDRVVDFLAGGRGAGDIDIGWPDPSYVTSKYLTLFMEAAERKFATVNFDESIYKYFENHPDELIHFENWQQRLINQRAAHLQSEDYRSFAEQFDYDLSNRALNLDKKLIKPEDETQLVESVNALKDDARFDAIDKDLKSVDSRAATLLSEKNSLETKVNRQAAEVQAIEDLLKSKDLDNDTLNNLLAQLKQIGDTHQARRQAVCTNLGAEADDLQKRLKIWENELTTYKGQLGADKTSYEQIKKEVDKLKEDISNLTAESKKNDDVTALKKAIPDLEKQVQAAKETYTKAFDEFAAKDSADAAEMKRVNDLEMQRKALETKLAEKNAELSKKEKEIKSQPEQLAKDLEQKKQDLTQKTATMNEQKQKIDSQEKRIESLGKNRDQLHTKIKEMDVDSLEGQVKNLPSRIEAIKTDIDARLASPGLKAK